MKSKSKFWGDFGGTKGKNEGKRLELKTFKTLENQIFLDTL
jgi:hypothetical protein